MLILTTTISIISIFASCLKMFFYIFRQKSCSSINCQKNLAKNYIFPLAKNPVFQLLDESTFRRESFSQEYVYPPGLIFTISEDVSTCIICACLTFLESEWWQNLANDLARAMSLGEGTSTTFVSSRKTGLSSRVSLWLYRSHTQFWWHSFFISKKFP